MTKPEAAKAFLEIAAQLRHENLFTGTVKAALRGEQNELFIAELDDKDITMQELPVGNEQEPFLAAFAIKQDAKALLLLYFLRFPNATPKVTTNPFQRFPSRSPRNQKVKKENKDCAKSCRLVRLIPMQIHQSAALHLPPDQKTLSIQTIPLRLV